MDDDTTGLLVSTPASLLLRQASECERAAGKADLEALQHIRQAGERADQAWRLRQKAHQLRGAATALPDGGADADSQ